MELHYRSCILKKLAKLFTMVICNPIQSLPFSAILVPFCSIITPLVVFFLSKPLILFYVSQHFNHNLGHQRNDSNYCDVAPLIAMPARLVISILISLANITLLQKRLANIRVQYLCTRFFNALFHRYGNTFQ